MKSSTLSLRHSVLRGIPMVCMSALVLTMVGLATDRPEILSLLSLMGVTIIQVLFLGALPALIAAAVVYLFNQAELQALVKEDTELHARALFGFLAMTTMIAATIVDVFLTQVPFVGVILSETTSVHLRWICVGLWSVVAGLIMDNQFFDRRNDRRKRKTHEAV